MDSTTYPHAGEAREARSAFFTLQPQLSLVPVVSLLARVTLLPLHTRGRGGGGLNLHCFHLQSAVVEL